MRTITLLLVLGYAITCIGAGLLGILVPHHEMSLLYNLHPTEVPDLNGATLLNQWRFLKAMELGAGLFMMARLGDIMAGGSDRRLFTCIVATGIAARLLAWVMDGRPSLFLIIFLALEILLLAALLIEDRIANAA